VYVPLKAGPKKDQPVPRNLDLLNIGSIHKGVNEVKR
jgi:hypothetical protein